jgi:hypothetical protein
MAFAGRFGILQPLTLHPESGGSAPAVDTSHNSRQNDAAGRSLGSPFFPDHHPSPKGGRHDRKVAVVRIAVFPAAWRKIWMP